MRADEVIIRVLIAAEQEFVEFMDQLGNLVRVDPGCTCAGCDSRVGRGVPGNCNPGTASACQLEVLRLDWRAEGGESLLPAELIGVRQLAIKLHQPRLGLGEIWPIIFCRKQLGRKTVEGRREAGHPFDGQPHVAAFKAGDCGR